MTQEALFRQIDQLYINMLSAAPTLGFVYSTPAEFALFVNERAYKNIDSFKFGSELPFHKLNRRPPLSCLMHWEHISLIYLKYMSKSLIWPYQALIRLIF